MKLRQPYKQHARRHLPGGSDPLPLGGVGLPTCFASPAVGPDLPAGNNGFLTFNSAADYFISDSTYFAAPAGLDGVTCKVAGMYLFCARYSFSGLMDDLADSSIFTEIVGNTTGVLGPLVMVEEGRDSDFLSYQRSFSQIGYIGTSGSADVPAEVQVLINNSGSGNLFISNGAIALSFLCGIDDNDSPSW